MLSIKLEQNEIMNSYLARLKICSDSLKEIGYEFRDDDLTYVMLSGLPDTYDGIVMTLANLDDQKFKSTEVKKILMNEYKRRAMKESGHAEERLKKEAHHQTKEYSKEEKRRCFKCNNIGYLANSCDSKSINTKRNKKRWTPDSKTDSTLLLELNNTQLDDSWLIDSGITHHVCKQRMI